MGETSEFLQHSDVVYSVKEHGLPNAANWHMYMCIILYIIYMVAVQNTFSRTALNRSANRVATAVPQ